MHRLVEHLRSLRKREVIDEESTVTTKCVSVRRRAVHLRGQAVGYRDEVKGAILEEGALDPARAGVDAHSEEDNVQSDSSRRRFMNAAMFSLRPGCAAGVPLARSTRGEAGSR